MARSIRQGPGSGGADNELAYLILTAVVLGFLYWKLDFLRQIWLTATLKELDVLSLLPGLGEHFQDLKARLLAKPQNLERLMLADRHAGWAIGALVGPVLLTIAWRAWKKRRVRSERRITLPLLGAILRYRPVADYERQGLTPEQWAAFYKLDSAGEDFEEKAIRAFTLQLGVRSDPGDGLIRRFAAGIGLPPEIVRKACERHAYRSTAMLRLLHYARERSGVVKTGFMRPVLQKDKSLIPVWFAIASLGRQTGFVEGAGIVAHYQVELSWGKPVADPAPQMIIVARRLHTSLLAKRKTAAPD